MLESAILRQRAQAVREFKQALNELEYSEAEDEKAHYMKHGPRAPSDPADSEKTQDIRTRVGILAGPAGLASQMAGTTLTDPRSPHPVNVISDWMRRPRDVVLDTCNLTIGVLEDRARLAEADEKSLAGRLARYLSIPRRVRELAGYEPNTAAGRATSWATGALLTIGTTAAASILTAIILRILGVTE